jgi:hypothetical protein
MRMPSILVVDSKADSPVAAIGDQFWQEEPCPRRPTRGGEPTVVRPQTRLRDRGPWTTESPRIAIWATRTRSCRIDAGNMAAAPTPGKTARGAVCNGGSPANRVSGENCHTSIAASMPTTTRRLTQRAGDDSIVSSIHLIKARHRFHRPRLSIGSQEEDVGGARSD